MCLALLVVATTWVAPAQAAPTVTVSGLAGTYVQVTLTQQFVLDRAGRQLTRSSAPGSDVFGVALINPLTRQYASWVRGTVGTSGSCPFATTCDRYDFLHASGSTIPGETDVRLAPGLYDLLLIARPGRQVAATLSIPGLSGALRATRRASALEVRTLPQLGPTAGDTSPTPSGSATFDTKGVTLTGVVLRLDTQTARSASYDLCLSVQPLSVPHELGCSGSGPEYLSTSGGVFYVTCTDQTVPTPTFCVPGNLADDSVTVASSLLVSQSPTVSYDATIQAVKSRGTAVAFAVSL